MKLAEPLLILHRSDLLTLSTMTYTGMQGLGFAKAQDIAMETCLVGIKSKAKAERYIPITLILFLYVDSMEKVEKGGKRG